MLNMYTCRNCKKKQPKPDNPFHWCVKCYSTRVLPDWQKGGGYLVLNGYFSKKSIHIAKFNKDNPPSWVTHYFYCDNVYEAVSLFRNAIDGLYNRNGIRNNDPFQKIELNENQDDYVKTIEKFEKGKFHFKGEVS